jgi:hypothetical protein
LDEKAINLFVSSADHCYGPITTIRHEGQIVKYIPWSVFEFLERDWKRVKEGLELLAVCERYLSFLQQLILL